MSRQLLNLTVLFALLTGFVFTAGVHAAGGAAPVESAPAAAPAPVPAPIPDSLKTPRATMQTFLEAMEAVKQGQDEMMGRAVSTLDLSGINPLVRKEKGRDLAWLLLEVIERTRAPDIRRFATRTSGPPFVFQTYPEGKVALVFVENRGWLFSAQTIAALPAILDGLAGKKKVAVIGDGEGEGAFLPLYLRIRNALPESLRQKVFVLEHWQWLGILLIITVGVVLDKLIAVLLRGAVRFWKRRYAEGAFRDVPDTMLRPLGLMAMAAVWWAGLNMLGLTEEVLVVLLVSVKFLAGISGVWAAYRLVDLLGAFLIDRAQRTAGKLDDALVPLVKRILKVFVTILGLVFVADNLNINVTSLLAGLGLGGLAFALAAKDVVGNLFGSVTVLLDQTFHVGDWVIIGDIEGTVETIGFRSTRIRTFYNSLVSVPNSTLITASVDNMGKRRYRRMKTLLSLAYETPPERIDAFCEGVRELVRLHPYMRKDYYHVYLNEFGASALEVLVYVFWETPDWSTELRERHRFLMDCLRLAKRLGVEYAYPTQTLYLRHDDRITPPEGDADEPVFQPSMGADEAQAMGRQEARDIVRATTGLDTVPQPVSFSPSSD